MNGADTDTDAVEIIKSEPPDPFSVDVAPYEDGDIEEYALPCAVETRFRSRLARSEELLALALQRFKASSQDVVGQIGPNSNKHTASPAQEATRARIRACESQLRRLYQARLAGKLDHKGSDQIHSLEEDLRKAHSKLRRLLNEAERQRRRRERLRRGLPPTSPSATAVPSRLLLALRGTESSALNPAYPSCESADNFLVTSRHRDRSIMAALRKCTKFKDVANELRRLGYFISKTNGQTTQVHELPEDDDIGSDDPTSLLEQTMEERSVSLIPTVVPLLDQTMEERTVVPLAENGESLERTMEKLIPTVVIKEEPLSPKKTVSTTGDEVIHDTPLNQQNNSAASATTCGLQCNHTQSFNEFARKQAQVMRDLQSQCQEWCQHQTEIQRQREESFKRELMSSLRTMLDGVTGSFVQGMQQLLQVFVSEGCSRPHVGPSIPSFFRNGVVPPETMFFTGDENDPSSRD